ncbi:MAG TPA: hypothetical protein VJ771_03295 [Candidatus Nitrosotalea sp.]|nr:hypothetical protein [Candidatus Nitrosotalea sp.]
MKTLHLAILVGSGITIATIFSVAYFFQSHVLSGARENPESANLDLSNYTKENPLGIKAQIVMEVDTAIMCPTKCVILPTPHLVLTSEKGTQFVGYQVCNGTSCKKDNLDNSLYIHLAQVPQNYSGTVGLEASHINLGNLPWSVGDKVHVLVKAFPVTLQTNNVVIREPEKTMVIDLGDAIIENYTTTNASTITILNGSEYASNQTQPVHLSNFIPPSPPPSLPPSLLPNGTAYVNFTALAYAKRHNWGDTFTEEKYHGTDLQIIATISNALKFSGTVTDPTGMIHYLTPSFQNGTQMQIQYYAAVSDPDGTYVVAFNVVNGTNTSNIDLQVIGNEIQYPPIPPSLHPIPP